MAKSASEASDAGTSPGWRAWFGAGRPWPAIVAGIIGVALTFWSGWRSLELKGYDALTVLTAPA